MSWGGAPPWVYKNQVAHAQNDAYQARSEASKANALANTLAQEQRKLMEQMDGILSEIVKYQEKKSSKKLSKKEMMEILETIAKITKDTKNSS